jgi:hypothetical protein
MVYYLDHEKDLVIAYFNHVDRDWAMDNTISFKALNEIRSVVDASNK